jgi:tetratricopeptide (TPR) repeat protein
MATETESPNLLKRCWKIASSFAISGILGLAAILTVVVITHLFYEALFEPSVVIEPISVPKEVEAIGYTPDVAALHLLDAMEKYVVRAHTGGTGPKLALHKDQADFALPNVGLSFKAVVAQIRAFIPIVRSQNISGEIMRVDKKLGLRLRKNAVVIYDSESPDGVDTKDPKVLKEAIKALFDGGALRVFAATHPYFEAVANSDKNPEAAYELAKKFIAEKRSDWPLDQDVGWAHNLLGLLLYEKGKLDDRNCKADDQKGKLDDQNCKVDDQKCKTDDQKGKADDQRGKLDGHTGGENTRSAIKEFKWVIDHPGFRGHDRRLAIAHLNLGLAYIEQGRAGCANAHLDKAIHIDPQLGIAYLKRGDLLNGDLLNQTGEAEKAPCAYLEAIATFYEDVLSDPFSAAAHKNLGDALNNTTSAKGCADPKDRAVVQRVLEHLDPYDSVIAEYERAAELDPEDAHIHYDLGSKWLDDVGSKWLENPHLLEKPIEELQKALDRHESPQEARKRREGLPSKSFDEFKYVLLTTLSHAKRIEARNHKTLTDCPKGKFEPREDELFCQAFRDNEALIERAEEEALIKRAEEKDRVDKVPNDNAAAYKRRGVNLYLMGKFEKAVDAYNQALKIDETYLVARIDRGYAQFALAHFADAAADFGDALKLPRGQVGTIVWLYLSRQHSRHPDAFAELQRNASRLLESSRQDWRIKLFKDNQLPDGVQNPDDVSRKEKQTDAQCKMYFYIGERRAIDKGPEAVEWLERAKTTCPFGLVERQAVAEELKRVKEELKRLEPLPGGAMGASPGVSTDRRRSRR